MGKTRLHLDADTSSKALHKALLDHGHDVSRTPNSWMALDATDEQQLLGATAQKRCIFTFNIRDFMKLSEKYPGHAGIIFSTQRRMPELLQGLDNLLTETQSEDWSGQIRWLKDWIR